MLRDPLSKKPNYVPYGIIFPHPLSTELFFPRAMEWELSIGEAKNAIAHYNAKKVLIQLPDGLKPHAKDIVDALADTGAELLIWTDSNYGSCDLPIEARNVGVDLVLHYGHESWNYEKPKVSHPENTTRFHYEKPKN